MLARLYLTWRIWKKRTEIKEIFKKYDEIKRRYSNEKQSVSFLDPAPDDLYFELGKIFYYLEDYEKALDNFKTANVINPLHGTALFNGAITLKKMGLTHEAAKMYRDAIKINPFLRETANNMLAETPDNEK